MAHGNLEAVHVALEKVLKRLRDTGAEVFARGLVRAESAVIAKVVIAAAETKLVAALDPGKILIDLDEVLGSAEGDAVARRERGYSRGNRCCRQAVKPFRRRSCKGWEPDRRSKRTAAGC